MVGRVLRERAAMARNRLLSLFATLSLCVHFVVVLVPASALAQVTIDNDAITILNSNPGLRQVRDFPPIGVAPNSNSTTDGITRVIYVKDCPPTLFGNHPGLTGRNLPKCLVVTFRGAAHSYESGYNKERTFYAVLIPNTPRVWRVYEDRVPLDPGTAKCPLPAGAGPPMPTPGGPKGIRVMAEFRPSDGQIISGEGQVFDYSCAAQVAAQSPAFQNANASAAPSTAAQQPNAPNNVWGAKTGPASYRCFVMTKNGAIQQVAIQAESDQAAQVAAVKQFGSQVLGVQCDPNQ